MMSEVRVRAGVNQSAHVRWCAREERIGKEIAEGTICRPNWESSPEFGSQWREEDVTTDHIYDARSALYYSRLGGTRERLG